MYLEGDSIPTLKYSMLYLESDMLFRIRYYIRIHILYLVRTDVPNWPKYTIRSQWYTKGEINNLLSALNSKIYDQHLLSLRAVGSFYFVH